jgi:predicted nuclease of predicted toxin-antitoxin system
MARLYTNENFPMQVVEELRGLGHDVLTIQETGKAGQRIPDEEVLDFARADNRMLLTLNRRHFIRLHSQQPNHAGIIICTFDSDFVGQANRIHAAIVSQAVLSGQLIRVNRPHFVK